MGVRFRKSFRIAKGVRLNVSKSGVSASFGGRGFSTSIGKRGTRVNVGIPGTGLSYSTKIGGSSSRSRSSRTGGTRAASAPRPTAAQKAVADITSYIGRNDFSFGVDITDSGEIRFIDETGKTIEDKQLIALLKKHPTYREQKLAYEQEARENAQANARRLREETESFLTIHRHAPAILTPSQYADELAALAPQYYEREPYDEPAPTPQGVRERLEAEAESAVTAILPWRKRRLAQEWVDERIDAAMDEARQAWEARRRAFELRQDEIERAENARLQSEFESQKRAIELAVAGDKDYIEDWIGDWLESCELPVEINVDFDFQAQSGRLMVDLDLPEIEDLPTTTTAQLASGKIKEKNKTQKQLKEEYVRCVLGLLVLVASTSFNASPKILNVVVSGYTQRRNKTGDINDDYIVSVNFDRATLASLDYTEAEPMDTVMHFENRMKLTAGNLFKTIEPYE